VAMVALGLQPFWIRTWLYSSISSFQYETIDPLFVAILMPPHQKLLPPSTIRYPSTVYRRSCGQIGLHAAGSAEQEFKPLPVAAHRTTL